MTLAIGGELEGTLLFFHAKKSFEKLFNEVPITELVDIFKTLVNRLTAKAMSDKKYLTAYRIAATLSNVFRELFGKVNLSTFANVLADILCGFEAVLGREKYNKAIKIVEYELKDIMTSRLKALA